MSFRVNVEENAPITDATAKAPQTSFEFTDVAEKRVVFHFINGKADASAVVGWDAFK
jgi:hypothetical protein